MMEKSGAVSGSRTYAAGVAVATVTSLLIVWTTIVRDDGTGIGSFTLIMAAMVGAFAARFRAPGMARAMFGTAIVQVLLGALIATAPSTSSLPGGPLKIALFSAFFAVLWLISALLFRAAAKESDQKFF